MSDMINALLILGLFGIVLGIICALVAKSKRLNRFQNGKNAAMSKGIATGICLGIPIGVAMQNIGAGIAIGVAIGAGIGRRMQKRESGNLKQ
jgi:hypothetical protein